MNQEQLTLEQAQALIAQLQQKLQQATAKAEAKGPGDVFVSDKGLICMIRGKNPTTGKGQWPVSMYPSDWALVIEHQEKIKAAVQSVLK